jgi:hypothetical protein
MCSFKKIMQYQILNLSLLPFLTLLLIAINFYNQEVRVHWNMCAIQAVLLHLTFLIL